jgi:hypothetical protein
LAELNELGLAEDGRQEDDDDIGSLGECELALASVGHPSGSVDGGQIIHDAILFCPSKYLKKTMMARYLPLQGADMYINVNEIFGR